MDSNDREITLHAKLVLSPIEVYQLLKQSAEALGAQAAEFAASQAAEEAPPVAEEKPKRSRKAKVEVEEAPEVAEAAKPEQLRLKIDSQAPIADQIKSIIVQAAAHKHGDAIGSRIFKAWNEADTQAVGMLLGIFPGVAREAIAKATMEASEATLSTQPNLFLMGIFKAASEMKPQAVAVPTCGICEQIPHAPGCPAALASRRSRMESDGGAMPSRVPNANPDTRSSSEPAAEAPEPCPLGGPGNNCPIPTHHLVTQGGARIYVHAPETVRAFREALGGAPNPQARFSAPMPPEPTTTPKAPAKRGGRTKKK